MYIQEALDFLVLKLSGFPFRATFPHTSEILQFTISLFLTIAKGKAKY